MSDYKLCEIVDRLQSVNDKADALYANFIGVVPKNVKRHIVFMVLSNICLDLVGVPSSTDLKIRYNGVVIKIYNLAPVGPINHAAPIAGCVQPSVLGPDYKNDIITVDGVQAGDQSLQISCTLGGGGHEGVYIYALYWDEVMV